MKGQVQHSASDAAQAMLDRLGRTEDVQFSPSNRRLAVAGYYADRIAVFDVTIVSAAGRKSVVLGGGVEVESPTLRKPHGLSFIDEDTIAVANREGSVQVFDLPPSGAGEPRVVVAARQILLGGADRLIDAPGSLAAVPVDEDSAELLVCNNYVDRVTRHVLDRRADYAPRSDERLLENRLSCPDGIGVSGDGRWIAVSNHNTRSVLLYDRATPLGPDREPDGVLRNVLCPHGVRFTPDQGHILVADASEPFVNVYERGAGTWKGTRDPLRLFRVLDDDVFRRGRKNPQEGGPKGLDVSKDSSVLVTTTECQTLAFFDLQEVLQTAEAPAHRHARYLQWRFATALYRRLGRMPGAPV